MSPYQEIVLMPATTSPDAHYISGLTDDKHEVDRALEVARRASGVVLYFHGGLSSENYMESTLGPWLLDSIFQDTNLGGAGGLHPIFVNYDAGPFDWEKIRRFLQELIVKRIVKALIGRFQCEQVKQLVNTDGDNDAAWAEAGRGILMISGMRFSDEQIGYLLGDEEAQRELQGKIEKADAEIAGIARDIEQFAEEKGAASADIGVFKPAKFIVRVAARFALGTRHQIEPTIMEEFLREMSFLGLAELAQNHWKIVYENTEKCWIPNNNGQRLIAALAQLRTERGGQFPIHVVSHSAGAIAIAYLVAYLARNNGPKLDNIIMLVPAVNLKLFAETIVAFSHTYTNFRAFVLKREKEESDNLASIVYPASLLYFVSGVAENAGFGDRMLPIEQHLRRRKPYVSDWYKSMFGGVQGEYEKVWDFFDGDGRLIYCPNLVGDSGRKNDGSSHSNTKYPWITRELAKSVLYLLTGSLVNNGNLPRPTKPPGAPSA